MTEHDSRALVTFSCGHSQYFRYPAPKQGETILCLRCRICRMVISAPDEWRLKCRNCIYTRAFGQAQLNCEISAGKHRIKYPGHVVDIYNGNVVRKTFGVQRNQTVMRMSSDSDQTPGY
jgi:hypothetical protein